MIIIRENCQREKDPEGEIKGGKTMATVDYTGSHNVKLGKPVTVQMSLKEHIHYCFGQMTLSAQAAAGKNSPKVAKQHATSIQSLAQAISSDCAPRPGEKDILVYSQSGFEVSSSLTRRSDSLDLSADLDVISKQMTTIIADMTRIETVRNMDPSDAGSYYQHAETGFKMAMEKAAGYCALFNPFTSVVEDVVVWRATKSV